MKYKVLSHMYLEICPRANGEPCDGDPSVGIQPCPLHQFTDIDGDGKPIAGGCLLEMERDSGAARLEINDFAAEVHKNAVDHGWWEEPRSLPEILMLCVSELAEALEEYRAGRPMFYCGSESADCETAPAPDTVEISGQTFNTPCVACQSIHKKPEGVAVELADCMIRILDYCGQAGIDIEQAIRLKHEYNKSRPYRHGGKKC